MIRLVVPINLNSFGSAMPSIEEYISKYMEIQRKPIVDLNKIKDSLQDPGGNVP
ncbi:MAG: hypothetical protein HPY52_15235 [Firmicutes bacterium]|nr:hypothetical protein [Bacillota bacterium]